MTTDRRSILRDQLGATLERTDLGIGAKYEGKVRDNYVTEDGRRIIVAEDWRTAKIARIGELLKSRPCGFVSQGEGVLLLQVHGLPPVEMKIVPRLEAVQPCLCKGNAWSPYPGGW